MLRVWCGSSRDLIQGQFFHRSIFKSQVFLYISNNIESKQMQSSNLSWEQCARLLMTIEIDKLRELVGCFRVLIKNILDNPGEVKYTKLKYDNTILQRKILSKIGGLELFQNLGFQVEIDSLLGEKFIVYPTSSKDDAGQSFEESEQNLLSGLKWIDNTLESCEEFIRRKAVHKSYLMDIPAQAILQLQLPTGKIILGGFLLGETLEDVRRYASSYFNEDRRSYVHLRLPETTETKAYIDSEGLATTIEQLELFPRAKLMVLSAGPLRNVYENEKAASNSNENKNYKETISGDADKKKANDLKSLKEEKKKREEERKREENHRRKVLQAFQEDRELTSKKSV